MKNGRPQSSCFPYKSASHEIHIKKLQCLFHGTMNSTVSHYHKTSTVPYVKYQGTEDIPRRSTDYNMSIQKTTFVITRTTKRYIGLNEIVKCRTE
jgi:hypothetical protein